MLPPSSQPLAQRISRMRRYLTSGALAVVLLLSVAGCSSPEESAAEALRACFEDAGEQPESVAVLLLTDDGQIAVVSAPGVNDAVVTRCIDDYNHELN